MFRIFRISSAQRTQLITRQFFLAPEVGAADSAATVILRSNPRWTLPDEGTDDESERAALANSASGAERGAR